MEVRRRRFLHVAASAAWLPMILRRSWAQSYPTRPVRVVVGFPPGGTTDIVARLMGQALSERLGQHFLIENRAGASANLAAEVVMRSPGDGYTLLALTSSNTINATLLENTSFNLTRDLAMVAGLIRSPLVLEVHPSVPVKTVSDFIALAKANPSKMTMASFGIGSSSHMAGELFKMMTGVDLLHVPYRGSGPMLTDLLSGQVQMAFDNLPASIEHIRAGKIRALAVTTATPSDALPNVPTVGSFVPEYEASAIIGIAAPRGTPAANIDKLNNEINAALTHPRMAAHLAELSATALVHSPADFSRLVADDIRKWAEVIRTAGLKAK